MITLKRGLVKKHFERGLSKVEDFTHSYIKIECSLRVGPFRFMQIDVKGDAMGCGGVSDQYAFNQHEHGIEEQAPIHVGV